MSAKHKRSFACTCNVAPTSSSKAKGSFFVHASFWSDIQPPVQLYQCLQSLKRRDEATTAPVFPALTKASPFPCATKEVARYNELLGRDTRVIFHGNDFLGIFNR